MCLDTRGLGSARFARHYSGNRCFFLFLQVLRCFSSLRLPRLSPVSGLPPDGLPHSDTPGSKPVCSSPGFFAAYRVLLRLQKPRHPPSALLSFCLLFESAYLSVFAFREIVFADLFFFLTSLSVPNIVKQLVVFPACHRFPFFSNGLQRYALFIYLQIFLQLFFQVFCIIFCKLL